MIRKVLTGFGGNLQSKVKFSEIKSSNAFRKRFLDADKLAISVIMNAARLADSIGVDKALDP